jgi:hypothetical protein
MEDLSFSGVGSFLVVGAVLGLALGAVVAYFLFRTGLFKRKMKFHNLLTKLNFPYVVLIFVACSSVFFGLLGIRAKIRDPFLEIEGRIIQVSVLATGKASADLREAFMGKEPPPEIIYEIAHIIGQYNESELTPLILSGDKYLSYAYEARKAKIYRSMEAGIAEKLSATLKNYKSLNSEILGEAIHNVIISDLKKGYAADIIWDRISSRFGPVFLRIFLYGALFFHFILYEPALYFLAGHIRELGSRKRRKNNPQEFPFEAA